MKRRPRSSRSSASPRVACRAHNRLSAAGSYAPSGTRAVPGGIVLHARHDKVDEGLARSLLFDPFQRPALLEESDAVPVACQKACEVFQAVLADERITLEIEEHVAARRLRQAAEPSPAFGGARRSTGGGPPLRGHLKARLMTEATIGLSASSRRIGRQSAVGLSNGDDGRKTLPLKFTNVRSPDIGDQREVVIATAAFIAEPPVVAHVAMRNRLRISRGWRRCRRGIVQPRTDQPVIRTEIRKPILSSPSGVTT